MRAEIWLLSLLGNLTTPESFQENELLISPSERPELNNEGAIPAFCPSLLNHYL